MLAFLYHSQTSFIVSESANFAVDIEFFGGFSSDLGRREANFMWVSVKRVEMGGNDAGDDEKDES